MSENRWIISVILKNGQQIRLLFDHEARANAAFEVLSQGRESLGLRDDYGTRARVITAEVSGFYMQDMEAAGRAETELQLHGFRTQARTQRKAQADTAINLTQGIPLQMPPLGRPRSN